jgi:hypothetical protein
VEAGSTAHVRALSYAWFSLNIIGGHFLVPVLLVTFLSSKAKRDATLINFGITLILTSVINCLLSVIKWSLLTPPTTDAPIPRLYANEYVGPEPSKGLCIFQAAGFGASAPTFVPSLLWPVIQALSTLSRSIGGQSLPWPWSSKYGQKPS